MIRSDREMLWAPGRMYFPVSTFTSMLDDATTGVPGGSGVGAVVTQEVSTLETVAILMDTAADEASHIMAVPYDLDRRHPIYVRVHWTSGSATAADTIDWVVRYLKIVPNVTVIASPATVLDLTIAQDTCIGVGYEWQTTEWGAIQPAATAFADNVELISWEVEMDAFAAGLAEDKFLLGLEIMYTPKRLYGHTGMPHEAKFKTHAIGDVTAN